MKLVKKIKRILEIYNIIKTERKEECDRAIIVSTFVLVGLYAILSVVNLFQKDLTMLLGTLFGFVTSLLGLIFAKVYKQASISTYINIPCTAVLLCSCVGAGGNNGFACLWLVLVPSIAMMAFDFKIGFILSMFFLLYSFLFFYTPIGPLLAKSNYEKYSLEFTYRFPILYFVCFSFSTYLAVIFFLNKYRNIKQERKLQESEKTLADKILELEEERRNLEVQKDIDAMTGLFNRTKYEEDKNTIYKNLASCGVIFCDVNNLKDTNDEKGHKYGDKLIVKASKAILSAKQENVRAYRYGGDEFIVITKNLDYVDIEMIVKQIKNSLETIDDSSDLNCSLAIGTSYQEGDVNLDRLVKMADENMYSNKSNMKEVDDSMYEY